jgi:tRNA modification GTPase
MLDDTIAAIATPLGEGGLAVIRISGTRAVEVADAMFVPAGVHSKLSAAPTHTIHYGHIVRAGAIIDEVLAAVMRAPRTLTREDVVEITCHGGILPAKSVLDAALANGARLADPGEFTRRAFLNGRIDLAQAEAVIDVIHARTELALRAANEQLAGKLSHRINALRDDLMKILAHVEAHIDFPDEDISPDSQAEIIGRLERGIAFMDELLRTASEGQLLRRGIRGAIVGRPNAGKSSLLNQLLGRDRAIVSPVPGTTRDTIEETANIRGIPVVFIDTAGLREAGDEIEMEGIRRSRESLEKAEFILHVLDASQALTDADKVYLNEFAGKKRILVLNKADLARVMKTEEITSKHIESPMRPGTENIENRIEAGNVAAPRHVRPQLVEVSCATGQGVEQLKDAVKELAWSGEIKAEMLEATINSRHQDALNRARTAVAQSIAALRQGGTLELAAMDLRIAANATGEIVGKTTTEDLLDIIFSQFCIGK